MGVNYKTNSIAHILLNEYYEVNLDRYIEYHSGKWVFIYIKEDSKKDVVMKRSERKVLEKEDVEVKFFDRKYELERAIEEKYGKAVRQTYVSERIPDKRRSILYRKLKINS